jgi:hypothetical protein
VNVLRINKMVLKYDLNLQRIRRVVIENSEAVNSQRSIAFMQNVYIYMYMPLCVVRVCSIILHHVTNCEWRGFRDVSRI